MSEPLSATRSADEIARALREYLPDGDRITGIVQLSAGHSNETYRVEGLDQILRLPPAGASLLETAFDVPGQRAILTELASTPGAPPVPVITYYDDEGAVLGAPFFMMERLPGQPWSDWAAPDWAVGQPESFLEAISRQLIDAMAALHALPPLVAFGPVRTAAQEVERWRSSLDGIVIPDRLARLFDDLIATAPELDRAAPCHGDPKLPNMLWDEGRLTAMLDWELGFNGDPRFDIAYATLPFASDQHPAFPGFDTPGLWQADRMIAEWARRSGRSPARMHWFEAANFCKVTAIYIYGHSLFARGLSDDPRFEAFGSYVAPFLDYAEPLERLDRADRT